MMKNEIERVLISKRRINRRIAKLANMINKDYENKEIAFIGIIKGCIPFLNELMMHVNLYCTVDYIRASSFNGGTESCGTVSVDPVDSLNIKGKDVIIVEDIIDSGKTLEKVSKILLEKGAKSIQIATLLDKPAHRTVDIKVKYVGFEIEDEFVIGFGLDYEEKYRNIPYVATMNLDKLKEKTKW